MTSTRFAACRPLTLALGVSSMRILKVGAAIIGSILLAYGVSILMSDVDPLTLCSKQCGTYKALSALLGTDSLRSIIGLLYVAISFFFLAPLVTEREESE